MSDSTTFSMVHIVPELKVSVEQAHQLGQDDENRLLENRKLVLLVDLDQTLIHTTNEQVPADLADVRHFQLYGPKSPWYHTKIRPGADVFLKNISKYFELHICTFGARLYAHKIAGILDPDRKLFSHRILSRDECFDPTSKTGNLKALFPRGDHMVCIIDDREDVWNYAPNVVHVKPYCFFSNTGDINSPHLLDENFDSQLNERKENLKSKTKDMKVQQSNLKSESSEKEQLEATNSDKEVAQKKENSVDFSSEEQGSVDATVSKSCESFVDSTDGYLLNLENILINIHKHYYEVYDEMRKKEEPNIPNLKTLIPDIRKKILSGCYIVFSSVIPTNLIAETSRFWLLAESLGAKVTSDLVLEYDSRTTHVISSKLGTAKVNAAKKYGDIHIVNVNWLFSCAERWERTDEKLYPLTKDIVPPFLDKHHRLTKTGNFLTPGKICGKSRDVGKRPFNSKKKKLKEEDAFMDKIFLEAGLALSQDEIDDMDREIEDACSADSDTMSESSDDSLSSSDYQTACKKTKMNAQDAFEEDNSEEATFDSVDEEKGSDCDA